MTELSDANVQPRWHQALCFALLGERMPELGAQSAPNVEALAAELRGRPDFATAIATARATAGWPVPVPADLMAGLGWAHFAAVLRALTGRLGLDAQSTLPPLTGLTRPDADDRRLLAEVPPHHVG